MRIASLSSSRTLAQGMLMCALAAPAASAFAQAAPPSRGGIIGYVTDRNTGQPLPYADVTVERAAGGFADAEGRFRIANLPTGEVHLRVRRVGYTPAAIVVNVSSTIDTVRVALSPLALNLARVRVQSASCGAKRTSSDTAIVAILQQVQLNAERAALLAKRYPYDYVMQRLIADEHFERGMSSGRVRQDTVRLDTVALAARGESEYQPGRLVREQPIDASIGSTASLMIPQLPDFADTSFVASHCFGYAGLVTIDGQRYARVDVEPAGKLPGPDARGSLYLDPERFTVVQTTLYLERPAPDGIDAIQSTRVDTWFREILPDIPVIDRVCARTTAILRSGSAASRVNFESQHLLRVDFVDRRPGDPAPIPPSGARLCPVR